jgi:septal ring factor EnvC (AmiA/AmiB activator)
MIADGDGRPSSPRERLLEFVPVVERGRVILPWTLVAASVLLVVIVLYLLFGGYLPARQRIVQLEAELREVYAREAQLQTRLQREDHGRTVREQQLAAFAVERAALGKRLEELEAELAVLKGGRKRR